MMTMNELVDLRMQQHIAHEILYRQQIMQRIPDPFPMLPIAMPRHVIMPPRVTLPGVEMTLQNDELWKQFHQIGTEMIITKTGRRMFPSMRISVAGLEEESHYCVLLEMVPIGDCRYKFSGSQWVPAGGAEPQSPQRMYIHPDSPATGAHWQTQPILFNKVKLTNNTLDNSGHIVLASMHKYQPRLHVIRTDDLAQIPWAPQQAFVFAETEFVAVTAYQNDRITKLKIDNNPFAKGFRETGQSRCKRKMSSSPTDEDQDLAMTMPMPVAPQMPMTTTTTMTMAQAQSQSQPQSQSQSQPQLLYAFDKSPMKSTLTNTNDATTIHGNSAQQPPQPPPPPPPSSLSMNNNNNNMSGSSNSSSTSSSSENDGPQIKRMRSNGSACSLSSSLDGGEAGASICMPTLPMALPVSAMSMPIPMPLPMAVGSPPGPAVVSAFMQHMQTLLRPPQVDLAYTYFNRPPPPDPQSFYSGTRTTSTSAAAATTTTMSATTAAATAPPHLYAPASILQAALPQLPAFSLHPSISVPDDADVDAYDVDDKDGGGGGGEDDDDYATTDELDVGSESTTTVAATPTTKQCVEPTPTKRKGFSISAILGGGS